ncbi:MAG: MarR family transcriptional regulator [Xanthomonadales bacterium]|nr:MarR family transcriptional regulator [Xanthomonadales bacterium]
MNTPPLCAGSSLGLLFRQVRDAMWHAMESELERLGHDLTFSQFVTLKKLGMTDGHISVGELARAAELSHGAMTRLLDKLEEKGLLARADDPTDRRALRIELTDAGRAIYDQCSACSDRVRERALSGMSASEREQFICTLERVRTNLTNTESA